MRILEVESRERGGVSLRALHSEVTDEVLLELCLVPIKL